MPITLRTKKSGQRACDIKDAKGKLCCGHLKRWYTPDEEAAKQLGKDAEELYRCERCQTLYRAAPEDRSSAGRNMEVRPVDLVGWAHKR